VDGPSRNCRCPVLLGAPYDAAAAGLDAADFEEDEEVSVLADDVSDFADPDLAASDFGASDLLLSDFALAPLLAASRLSVR
jgi:hypothetical protein